MKFLLIIFSISPKVTSEYCAAYNCSNSHENNPEKILFTLPKNGCTRKAVDSTLMSNHLSASA